MKHRILTSSVQAMALGLGLAALVGCSNTDYRGGRHGDHYRSSGYYGGDYSRSVTYRQQNAYPVVGYSRYSPDTQYSPYRAYSRQSPYSAYSRQTPYSAYSRQSPYSGYSRGTSYRRY